MRTEDQAVANLYPREVLDDTQQIRAQARLEQILATDPHPARGFDQAQPKGFETRQKALLNRRLRWAAIPVAVAAGLIAGIVTPNAPTLPPAHASVATWRAQPTAIPNAQLQRANEICGNADILEPVTAELRNDWALLTRLWPTGTVQACLVWFQNSAEGQQVAAFASEGPMAFTVTVENEALTGLVLAVGDDFTDAVIHTPNAGDVTATVANGFMIAWWPGNVERPSTTQDGQRLMPYDYTYTVTRQDGSTETLDFPELHGCLWDAETLGCS